MSFLGFKIFKIFKTMFSSVSKNTVFNILRSHNNDNQNLFAKPAQGASFIKKEKCPKISVIIPTYNRADLLPVSVSSVLNQTFKNLELIIVDDGSIDNTKEIVEQFVAQDNRVKYLWQKNSGIFANPINKGLAISRGDYIAFLDSDDEWLPEKLEKQLELLENSDQQVGIVGCHILIMDQVRNLSRVKKLSAIKIDDKNIFRIIDTDRFFICNSVFLIKKEVFDAVGSYDENLKFFPDGSFILSALQKFDLLIVPEILLKYYIHGKNISLVVSHLNLEQQIQELQYILKAHQTLFDYYPSAHNHRLSGIASLYIQMGNMKQARKFLKKAIYIQPTNLGCYSRFLATFLGQNFYRCVSQASAGLKRVIKSKY